MMGRSRHIGQTRATSMYQVHWHCVLWQISVIIIVVIDKPILKAQSGEGGEVHCEVQLRCIVVSPSAMTDKFAHQ